MFGKKVYFCEKYISTNKFKLEATGSSFGDGHSWHVALPGTQLPLLINEIEEIVVAVNQMVERR
jgi:hypothetical protein